ncbi:hypothetical protein AB9P05_14165 [Roseivirga sp. BDSF3-8]|uniref:hypothetical protein n=1 Tax=Roseivirga sp. BDSF3-8 TaxID=3241598 RepID=UPI00353244F9
MMMHGRLFFIVVFILSFVLYCKPTEDREIVEIPEGKVGMIGYGSLTSKKQLDVQLGRKYEGPLRIVHLLDYQRFWTACSY